MNCQTFQRRLQSILDERLPPQDDSELVQHAWQCEHCHQLLDGQQQLWSLLSSEPAPAPPSDMANRIIAHINVPMPGLSGSTRFAPWMWLAVAASLLIIASPIALQLGREQNAAPNSFVDKGMPPINDQLAVQEPMRALSAREQQEIDRMLSVFNRLREQQLDQSVDEITSPLRPTLRPITASFGLTLDALRKTLPLPNKNGMPTPKPQADARDPDIFA